jgi:hypothetical protein
MLFQPVASKQLCTPAGHFLTHMSSSYSCSSTVSPANHISAKSRKIEFWHRVKLIKRFIFYRKSISPEVENIDEYKKMILINNETQKITQERRIFLKTI